jgi:hypothetical protein
MLQDERARYPDAEKRIGVEGWITLDKAKELFAAAGQNFDALHDAARQKEFKPVALNAKANFDVKITSRTIQSHNVVAKIEGSRSRARSPNSRNRRNARSCFSR